MFRLNSTFRVAQYALIASLMVLAADQPPALAQTTGQSAGPSAPQRSSAPQSPPMRVQPPGTVPSQPANTFVGLWIDHTGDGAIEILPCPRAADQLCGTIVWLKTMTDANGQPLRDGYNEDERLRRRTICGLQVIGGLRPQASGTYDEGWIYDPRQGKSFSVELSMKGTNQLQVVGYKGVKFLSKTFQWKRSAQQLPRCGSVQAKTL